LRDYPSGRLNREQFRHFHQRFFPYGDPGQFAEYFFSVFDTDQDGEISFKEFICPLSLTLRGDPGEKLECAYPSFPPSLPVVCLKGWPSSDVNASSLILTHDLPGIFRLYDIDHDGTITYDEMLQIVQSVYKLVGQTARLPKDEDTPEKVRSD